MDIQHAFLFAACAEKSSQLPARGALLEIGGKKIHGSTMNGTLRFIFVSLRRFTWSAALRARSAAYIAFITTRFAAIGLCGEFTTDLSNDLHRATCAFGIQLSGRRFFA